MIINFCIKYSDFLATLKNNQGDNLGLSYNKNLQEFFKGEPGDAFVELQINVKTGKIENWKDLSTKKLKQLFKYQ